MNEAPSASIKQRALTLLPQVAGQGDWWMFGAVAVLAALSAWVLYLATASGVVAAGFGVASLVLLGLIVAARHFLPNAVAKTATFDWAFIRTIADARNVAIAVTDRAGRLVCANRLYEDWFDGPSVPPALALDGDGQVRLTAAGKAAWRDGRGTTGSIVRKGRQLVAEIARAGLGDSHLVWTFRSAQRGDLVAEARRLIAGEGGERLGDAGIMGVLIGADGRIEATTRAFELRATGRIDAQIEGREFVIFLESDQKQMVRFAREGRLGVPLRLFQVPVVPGQDGPMLVFIVDDDGQGAATSDAASVALGMQSMMAKLPLGLSLTDRDGRFLFFNDAFARAVGIDGQARPVYPSDLVVREDKAVVADTVRKHALGQQHNSDIAVRLVSQPEEPVALTIAGTRGLGEAAVLLSIKDSSEENRLKKQVAQQTKMQAVGQLAGGVAHDFNNILTGILGHCDLMLMRHTPGDSDYDDIQQIKNNSNRAASLTRQLLAFSRQQTLRPQILQLPDIVSEISNLLKRLMGETVTLDVKHGRNLSPVRADPGQLEQVIVNLAVNARDAMTRGGTLTIQTYAVDEADVRKLGHDILPAGAYTALSVTDTGHGIQPELLPKIFEPFFTTKEVGRGTGLGLSTVYGIVKQSGGYIFADSVIGEGTTFVIYLPVHIAVGEVVEQAVIAKEKPAELWGSGTILLVEDEDMVRAVAERALTRHGYTILTAANGEEALEVLAAHPDIDLLVSDVVMPIMDGPTMVRQARAQFPNMPILFMSGYAEEQLRKSISIEHVNFLPKPFSVQQLAEAVQAAMPR